MNFSFRVLHLTCLFAFSISGFAQLDSTSRPTVKINVDKNDTIQEGKHLTIIPMVFYTPETEFGFGMGGQGTFYTKGSNKSTRPSSIFFSGIYTTRNQFMLMAEPKIYFNNESFLLEGKYEFKIFPDKFWGIGNESEESAVENFNMRSNLLEVIFTRRLKPYVNFGFEYFMNDYKMLETVDNGLLEDLGKQGEDAFLLGLGLALNFDSRDNYQSPNHGTFTALKTGVTSKALGSTHGYRYSSIDLRKYFPIGKKKRVVLAAQAYLMTTDGQVPFQKLARYGGSIYARGYYKGRYTDNNMFVFQTESRFRVKERWTIAAFILGGDVFGESSNVSFESLKASLGGGVRYQIRKGDPTSLRIDVAKGLAVDNIGVYFGVNEAF
jgi:outer membrane protein assembly factor BamA